MTDENPQSPGHLIVDGVEYLVRSPGNIPYCHLCRQRVSAVVDITNGCAGNPVRACRACLETRIRGFEKLPTLE